MKLVIAFTDQSESFTHGVELGRLLQMMEDGAETVSNRGFPIHVENRQVLLDSCVQYGYVPSFSACSIEGWVDFFAIKSHSRSN